jgi:hypothetical protein
MADFTCQEQGWAMVKLLNGREYLFDRLPTGSGKSLVVLVPVAL